MNKVYLSKKLLEVEWVDEKVSKLSVNDLKEKLRARIEKFKRYKFNTDGLVLDVGTGSGIDLLALFSINPEIEVVGIDFSKKALEFAKKILPKERSHLVLADATHLPFREGSFKAINVSNMLHHHPLRLLKLIIKNLASLLKGDGFILIEEPSVDSEGEALREEIDTLRFEFEVYSKIRHEATSKRLQAYLYDLVPIFRYGTTYPSLIRKVIEECGLKIQSFDVRVEKHSINDFKMLSELRERIESSVIPSYEKAFLMEKVDAIAEKLKLIKPANYKSAVFKANKPNLTSME